MSSENKHYKLYHEEFLKLDALLKQAELRVYLYLVSKHPFLDSKISIDTAEIAEMLGLTRRRVQMCVKKLGDLKLIELQFERFSYKRIASHGCSSRVTNSKQRSCRIAPSDPVGSHPAKLRIAPSEIEDRTSEIEDRTSETEDRTSEIEDRTPTSEPPKNGGSSSSQTLQTNPDRSDLSQIGKAGTNQASTESKERERENNYTDMGLINSEVQPTTSGGSKKGNYAMPVEEVSHPSNQSDANVVKTNSQVEKTPDDYRPVTKVEQSHPKQVGGCSMNVPRKVSISEYSLGRKLETLPEGERSEFEQFMKERVMSLPEKPKSWRRVALRMFDDLYAEFQESNSDEAKAATKEAEFEEWYQLMRELGNVKRRTKVKGEWIIEGNCPGEIIDYEKQSKIHTLERLRKAVGGGR